MRLRELLGAQTEAGLPKDKVVAAHGNFDSATCISTGNPVPIEEVRDAIMGEDREGWKQLRDRHGGLVCPPPTTPYLISSPDANRPGLPPRSTITAQPFP